MARPHPLGAGSGVLWSPLLTKCALGARQQHEAFIFQPREGMAGNSVPASGHVLLASSAD